jgi:hypothetical protein
MSFARTCWSQQTKVKSLCGDVVTVLGYRGLKFRFSEENMREVDGKSCDPYEWSHLVKIKIKKRFDYYQYIYIFFYFCCLGFRT